jgi:aspartate dehydrogenase
MIFRGSAREAAAGFPANANVAAALALAGVGPDLTEVEIWADPAMTRNRHIIRAETATSRLTVMIESEASAANPRTGQLAPLSVIACLKGLTSTLKIGG